MVKYTKYEIFCSNINIAVILFRGLLMNDKIKILLVTANENETNALLNDKTFTYEDDRSADPNDTTYYRVGTYGHYDVVHFELNAQGSVNSESAILAVYTAIREYGPDAVILVGIAFGKGSDNEKDSGQKIGTVLISEKVADYESGKIKDQKIQSDGAIPEAGPQLLSAFKHYSKTWDCEIENVKMNCEFGMMLSGDKCVDDPEFKKILFSRYPRAIGGEMEGRGAYAACRRNNINEWIIIKAICDWGDGSKSEDKEHRQKIAAESAVSLLHHLFNNRQSFEKIPKLNQKKKMMNF